jgi:hypothetical protein
MPRLVLPGPRGSKPQGNVSKPGGRNSKPLGRNSKPGGRKSKSLVFAQLLAFQWVIVESGRLGSYPEKFLSVDSSV